MHNEAWTPEIDALAVRMRKDERLSAKVIAARLGRTPGAVSARLLKLGVTIHGRSEWEDRDVDLLRRLVADGELSIRAVARVLGRTECSVRWKIEDIGLKPGRLRPWTKAEDTRLLASAGRPEEALRALAADLDRSYEALRARLVRLGVRRKASWDRRAVAALRALAERGATLDEAATELGREPGPVRSKAYALGLQFGGAARRWDEAADAGLRERVRVLGTGPAAVEAMASETGRSVRSVRSRMRELGLGRVRRRRPLDEGAREEILAAARSGMTLGSAVRGFGRDARTLRAVAAEAGAAFAVPDRPVRPARVAPQVRLGMPRAAVAAVTRRPSPPRPTPAAQMAGMGEAIARFVRERGVTRPDEDPVSETVRRIRARGYAVTGDAADGFVVDGRIALAGAAALFAFATDRGIPVPAEEAVQ